MNREGGKVTIYLFEKTQNHLSTFFSQSMKRPPEWGDLDSTSHPNMLDVGKPQGKDLPDSFPSPPTPNTINLPYRRRQAGAIRRDSRLLIPESPLGGAGNWHSKPSKMGTP